MENKKVKPILVFSIVAPGQEAVDCFKKALKEQGAYDDYVIVIKNSPDKEGVTLINQDDIKSVEVPYLKDSTRLFKTPLWNTSTYIESGKKVDTPIPQFPNNIIENHGEIKNFWPFATCFMFVLLLLSFFCK